MSRFNWPQTWSVYLLTDPRNEDETDVRYVGCTNAPDLRLQQHLSSGRKPAKYRGERRKAEWIAELLALGLEPEMYVRHSFRSRRLAYSVELALRHAFADVITNPPRALVRPCREPEILLATIARMSEQIHYAASRIRFYARCFDTATDREHLRSTANDLLEHLDEDRAAIGLPSIVQSRRAKAKANT